jgi:hypothetical protein
MSGSNDNLKGMFQEAFAAEQIPVDMEAWGQMETLLDKKKPLGFAFWTWIPAIFMVAGLASWFALTSLNEEVYQPRNANTQFEPLNVLAHCDSQHLWDNESLNTPTYQSKPTLAAIDAGSAYVTPVESRENSQVQSSTRTVNSAKPTAVNINKSDELSESSRSEINSISAVFASEEIEEQEGGPMQTEPTSSSINVLPAEETKTSSKIALAKDEIEATNSATTRLDITKMELANLLRFDSTAALANLDSKPLTAKTEYLPSIYIKAGVNKSFDSFTPYSGFGQTVGIGYMRQIKHHLILSGELNGTRHRVGDTAMISGETAYGFKRFKNEYVVKTTELIRFNTTLMAHYRMKRLYIGGGLQPWVLAGLKNTTEQVVQNSEATTPVETTEGYFQWDRYNRTGLNAVVDAQYQILDDTFIGIRGAYGITNSLNVEYKALRLLEIQAYLKLNIR